MPLAPSTRLGPYDKPVEMVQCDICMPAEGIFHNLILVAIRKSYPGHASGRWIHSTTPAAW
jgi:UbiD family decarboxylase